MMFSVELALEKLQHFCSYQDRSVFEAEEKLKELGVNSPEERAEILMKLKREGFLDDERFARSYVRGKFRLKHWGRIKIKQGLRLHRISDYCMTAGFEEIEDDEYWATLQHLALQKWQQQKVADYWVKKKKVGSYLLSKGYETDNVMKALAELAEV